MQIPLNELFTSEGKEKAYTCEIETDRLRLRRGSFPITSKEPISLRVQNLGGNKILLEGHTSVHLSMPCDRCLEPVDVPFDLEWDEELDLGRTEGERAADLDEQPYVSGFNLDVDLLLCNELLLNLPVKILCREDCKGICNRCGANLNHTSCTCEQISTDPRMSVIQDIFQKYKEV
ncbi:MAG: DUF177 domain-containing protein [Clostridiales bacterium]|nr:DUF177 domain-containing protein [Clostridiales bacterium]